MNVEGKFLEVREVINLINNEYKSRIPKEITDFFDNLKSDYTLKCDSSGNIILSEQAKSILVYLYKKYIINENSQTTYAFNSRIEENDRIKSIIDRMNKQRDGRNFK